MPIEMDDTEFEFLLERIFELWDAKVDTFDMATQLKVSEAKIHHVFICAMEGIQECKQDEQLCDESSSNLPLPETSGGDG